MAKLSRQTKRMVKPNVFTRATTALLAVARLITLFSSPVLATHSTPFPARFSSADYLNPNTGRFWTADTHSGNNHQPLSLHKYFYVADNPVNNTDPTGHDIESLLTVMDISVKMFAQISPVTSKLSAFYSVPWGASRSLTSGEIDLARTIYGENIDYSKTGVDYGKWKSWFPQPKGREMTPDGIIHLGGVTIPDYSRQGGLTIRDFMDQKGTLIHELCHVWQHQQGVNVVLEGLYRNYSYDGPNFGKLAFSDYGIEQQAQMTEDYFYLRNRHRSRYMPTPEPSLETYEKIIPFLPK